MKIWEPKLPGTFWATLGLLRDIFTFTFYKVFQVIALLNFGNISFFWTNKDVKHEAVLLKTAAFQLTSSYVRGTLMFLSLF
jgi:hypothetical protein